MHFRYIKFFIAVIAFVEMSNINCSKK